MSHHTSSTQWHRIWLQSCVKKNQLWHCRNKLGSVLSSPYIKIIYKLQDIENRIGFSFGMYPWPLTEIWHRKQMKWVNNYHVVVAIVQFRAGESAIISKGSNQRMQIEMQCEKFTYTSQLCNKCYIYCFCFDLQASIHEWLFPFIPLVLQKPRQAHNEIFENII